MSRIGKIKSINLLSGLGEIIDENEQEISFILGENPENLYEGQRVFFEIELKASGLQAVQVQLIK